MKLELSWNNHNFMMKKKIIENKIISPLDPTISPIILWLSIIVKKKKKKKQKKGLGVHYVTNENKDEDWERKSCLGIFGFGNLYVHPSLVGHVHNTWDFRPLKLTPSNKKDSVECNLRSLRFNVFDFKPKRTMCKSGDRLRVKYIKLFFF